VSLLTLMFGILVAAATVEALREFEQISDKKRIELQWTARWIESEQLRYVAQANRVALLVMNRIRNDFRGIDCRRGVVDEFGLDPGIGRFAIADAHGRISCNSIPWLTATNVADRDYFQRALVYVDRGAIAEANNHNRDQYAAVLARAMRDADGRVRRVILVAMDFSWIAREIEATHLPAGGHLLVMNATGTVVAGSRNVAPWIDKNIADTPFYREAPDAEGRTPDSPEIDGMPRIVVVHHFGTGPHVMQVIIDVPRDVLLRPAYRNLAATLLFSVVVFAAILALAYYWSDRHFVRRIMAIERTANALAGGELAARSGLGGGDEIGRLAQSFDAMADALQTHESQLRATNEDLYRVNRALRVLSAGNRSLLLATSEQELLDRICREIVEEGGYLAAWIGFIGPGRDNYLHPAAAYSKVEDETTRLDWNTAGNGLEPVLTAVREARVLVINDTNHETVHRHLSEQAARFGYRSIVVLPLYLEGNPFGALILCAYRENEFGDTQVEYLKETASDISFGIEMLRTRGERNRLALLGEHHERMLRNSLEAALRSISMTIEMRDPYTAGHQRRVADLTKALATKLGMKDEEVHGLYLAAIVHDIGKITIPAEILVKPAKLNEMEYLLVKDHAAASYEILKGIRFPWPIAEIVRQHHERLDGSGYPLGLMNGDILFGARIMAVADVVETMSSHRPYRPALGIAAALREIKQGRGRLYDATVVDACLKLFGEKQFEFD
jgi:HAMP domain-containing protein